jgi:hypothetical protein
MRSARWIRSRTPAIVASSAAVLACLDRGLGKHPPSLCHISVLSCPYSRSAWKVGALGSSPRILWEFIAESSMCINVALLANSKAARSEQPNANPSENQDASVFRTSSHKPPAAQVRLWGHTRGRWGVCRMPQDAAAASRVKSCTARDRSAYSTRDA